MYHFLITILNFLYFMSWGWRTGGGGVMVPLQQINYRNLSIYLSLQKLRDIENSCKQTIYKKSHFERARQTEIDTQTKANSQTKSDR